MPRRKRPSGAKETKSLSAKEAKSLRAKEQRAKQKQIASEPKETWSLEAEENRA